MCVHAWVLAFRLMFNGIFATGYSLAHITTILACDAVPDGHVDFSQGSRGGTAARWLPSDICSRLCVCVFADLMWNFWYLPSVCPAVGKGTVCRVLSVYDVLGVCASVCAHARACIHRLCVRMHACMHVCVFMHIICLCFSLLDDILFEMFMRSQYWFSSVSCLTTFCCAGCCYCGNMREFLAALTFMFS